MNSSDEGTHQLEPSGDCSYPSQNGSMTSKTPGRGTVGGAGNGVNGDKMVEHTSGLGEYKVEDGGSILGLKNGRANTGSLEHLGDHLGSMTNDCLQSSGEGRLIIMSGEKLTPMTRNRGVTALGLGGEEQSRSMDTGDHGTKEGLDEGHVEGFEELHPMERNQLASNGVAPSGVVGGQHSRSMSRDDPEPMKRKYVGIVVGGGQLHHPMERNQLTSNEGAPIGTDGKEHTMSMDEVGLGRMGVKGLAEVAGEECLEDSAESSSETDASSYGEPEEEDPGPVAADYDRKQSLQLDHVDAILDNIDAELNGIINRKHKDANNNLRKTAVRKPWSSMDDVPRQDDRALDTGLGSDSREPSPHPAHQPRTNNQIHRRNIPREPPSDLSDTESIASVDIRARVREVLTKHDPPKHAPLSRYPTTSLIPCYPHSPRVLHGSPTSTSTKIQPLTPPSKSPTLSSKPLIFSPEPRTLSPKPLTLSPKPLTRSPKPLISPHPRPSHSPTSSKKKKYSKKLGDQSNQLGATKLSHDSSSSVDNTDVTIERDSDLDSVATEDFETKFQEIAPKTPPSGGRSEKSKAPTSVSSVDDNGDFKDPTDELGNSALSQTFGERHSFVKVEKRKPPPPPRMSGLPEYMYLRKEVTESDVGSDSIWTEDYEKQYLRAGRQSNTVPGKPAGMHAMLESPPVGRGLPIKPPAGRRIIAPESDAGDSVQTEDYESHFNHLMVKHLAGVPLRYYDGVSAASDLDSFRSTEVQENVELFKSGKKPKPSSKKKKAGRGKQKRRPLTSTPYRPKEELTAAGTEQNRMIGKQGMPKKLNLHGESVGSYQSEDLYLTETSDITDGLDRRSEDLDISEAKDHKLTQRMEYLMNAERELRGKVKELETSMTDIQTQREAALDDLKSLQDTAQRSRTDIQRARTIARESVEKAEEIRSELVILEYQRDQARRELGKIEPSATMRPGTLPSPIQQHRMMQSLDNIHLMTSPRQLQYQESTSLGQLSSTPQRMNRRTQHDHLNMRSVAPSNSKDVHHSGRDDTQESSSDKSSATPMRPLLNDSSSKDHSDPLLTPPPVDMHPTTNSELFTGPQLSQGMETKHEQVLHQITAENRKIKEDLEECQKKLKLAEDTLHRNKQEFSDTQNQLQKDITDLRSQLHAKVIKLDQLEGAMLEQNNTLKQVRQQVLKEQQNMRALQEEKVKLMSQHAEECQKLEQAKDAATVELRGVLLAEKEGAIQLLQSDMVKEKHDALSLLEEQIERLKEMSLSENKEKDEEILELRDKVRQLEDAKESLGDQMRREAEEQIQKAISAEREVWQTEAVRARDDERREIEGKLGEELSKLQQDMENAGQDKEYLKTSIKNLKEENDKLREENLAAGREKVEAVSEAREETRQDIQTQLDNMREDMTQEKLRATEKLKDKLSDQEEELGRLRVEVKGHQQREKESLLSANVEKIDRTLVQDLNDECQKTANLLGEPPRKVPVFMNLKTSASMPLPGSSGDQTSSGSNQLATRSQLLTAVANMRLTNEELRSYAKKLKDDGRQHQMKSRFKESEIEKLQSSIDNGKEESRANLEEIQEEHRAEADRLKRALHKLQSQEQEYQEQIAQKDQDMRAVQQNMRGWKEETALKMARKFEEELNRELETRLSNLSLDGSISHLSGSRSMDVGSLPHSSVDNTGTMKVLRHLQDKVKQLRMENASLKMESREEEGESNHQYDSKDQQVYRLNQRVKVLERQLSVAEGRCRENASQLSKSSLETTRLEGALTQQTKELMRMERAYERLSKSPGPYGHV